MLWLYDSGRVRTAALPEYSSIITTDKLSEVSTIEGKLPLSAYDALSAAYYVTIGAEDRIYVLDYVGLVTEGFEGYVEIKGREATCLLDIRSLVGAYRWSGKKPGYIVADLLRASGGIPTMTGAATPAGTASASGNYSTHYPYKAFDTTLGAENKWLVAGTSGWLQYQFNAPERVVSYTLCPSESAYYARLPRDWTLKGSNNGTAWTTLDTQSGRVFNSMTPRSFTVATPGLYAYYRLDVTANGGDAGYMGCGEMTMTTDRALPLTFGTGDTLGSGMDLQQGWGNALEIALGVLASQSLGMRTRLVGTTIYVDVFAPQSNDIMLGDRHQTASSGRLVRDSSTWCNYAYVLGEGEGAARVLQVVDLSGGSERRELYVDASDLASTVDGVTLTSAEYKAALLTRGAEKLAETRLIEYADATLDTPLKVGDVVQYDALRWSAFLMVTEAKTVREGGTKYSAVLGEPPSTLKKSIKRLKAK